MTIKEVEERTGLARSSIRFYEKEKLIHPDRNDGNGYRNYTKEDVESIRKIAYLRTLGISIESIHQLIDHEAELRATLEKQTQALTGQIRDLEKSRFLCEQMLKDEGLTYDGLDIEAYVPKPAEYWKANREVLKMDSVGFFTLWGGSAVWGAMTGICLLLALFAYPRLPARIPIQWSGGEASSEVGKAFIFAYPLACVVVRFLLRPFIGRRLGDRLHCGEALCDYVTNYLCFLALSVQAFTLLYVNGLARHVAAVLWADTIVLIGILLIGGRRWSPRSSKKEPS